MDEPEQPPIPEPYPPIKATVDGNQLELVDGGEARMRALLDLINGAQSDLRLLFYIFNNDEAGTRVRDALVEAARRGVKVKVLLDGFGSGHLQPKFFSRFDRSREQLLPVPPPIRPALSGPEPPEARRRRPMPGDHRRRQHPQRLSVRRRLSPLARPVAQDRRPRSGGPVRLLRRALPLDQQEERQASHPSPDHLPRQRVSRGAAMEVQRPVEPAQPVADQLRPRPCVRPPA